MSERIDNRKKEKKQSSKKRRKRIMIIAIVLISLLLIGVIGYLIFMKIQLDNLSKMTVDDMISYVTEEDNTYVSIAVIENGEISIKTYSKDGIQTDGTEYDFEIGSMSKTLAALMVSKAISEGKLDLSASISEYIDLPKDKYYPTIERIITHTAGYKPYYFESPMVDNWFHQRNDFYKVDRDMLLNKVRSLTLEDKDYKFEYSNFGISVLGLVLEAVYNKDYTTLLTEYLTNELHLSHSGVATCTGNLTGYWDWAKNDGYIPAGAVISTISDMASYLNFCMTSDDPYVKQTFQVIKPVNSHNTTYESMGIIIDEMAMTWIHDKTNHIMWHNGGTSHFNSYIAISDDFSKGIVILSNYGPNHKFPVTVIGAKMMAEK